MTVASLGLLFVLGLTMSAAPGALNVETVRRGVSSGFQAALTVQLGALLGDAVWVGVTVAGVLLGLQTAAALPVCLLLGGAAMLWTAWQVARPAVGTSTRATPVVGRGGLVLGGVLALSSPLTMVFWAAVTGMVREDLGRAASTAELGLVAVAYALSVLVWAVGLSGVAAWGGGLVRPGPARLLNLGCAALLVVWGVQLIGRGAGVLA